MYLAIGCAVAIHINDLPWVKSRHGVGCGGYSHKRYKCSCVPGIGYSIAGGSLWPFTGLFLVVWAIMRGTKQPKGTRLGRAQRKARKTQAYIEQLERDLGITK